MNWVLQKSDGRMCVGKEDLGSGSQTARAAVRCDTPTGDTGHIWEVKASLPTMGHCVCTDHDESMLEAGMKSVKPRTKNLVETKRIHRSKESQREANSPQEVFQVSPSFPALPRMMLGSPMATQNKRPIAEADREIKRLQKGPCLDWALYPHTEKGCRNLPLPLLHSGIFPRKNSSETGLELCIGLIWIRKEKGLS